MHQQNDHLSYIVNLGGFQLADRSHTGKLWLCTHKAVLQEAICWLLLRYNFATTNIAVTCICGELNTVYQTLICKRGPFVNCRHNRPRDVIAELLNKCLPCQKSLLNHPFCQSQERVFPEGQHLSLAQDLTFLQEVSTHQWNEHFFM